MSAENTFKGWTYVDEKAGPTGLEWKEFKPKPFEEDDVEVAIKYCGVCGSDHSVYSGAWGPPVPEVVCGHEIIGTVVRVGSQNAGLAVGDEVGIGAQADSCGECEFCKSGDVHFCSRSTYTFPLAKEHTFLRGESKGVFSRGGYANFWRGPANFAVKIPEGLEPATAAPLLCGGVTVYAPLARHGAGTRAKKVAILGVGGLGHMGIMIAKAMGAEVTAISRGTAKREDALKLGATHHIATGSDLAKDFADHKSKFDLIISTINPPSLDMAAYVSLLRPTGLLCLVGVIVTPLEINSMDLLAGSRGVVGSGIGSPNDIRDLFALAAKHNFMPWIQKYNMEDANKAMLDFEAGKPQYRFVLVNTENGGKM